MPRLEPALVGMSCMLVGAPGMPPLTEMTGKVALEQGPWGQAAVNPAAH